MYTEAMYEMHGEHEEIARVWHFDLPACPRYRRQRRRRHRITTATTTATTARGNATSDTTSECASGRASVHTSDYWRLVGARRGGGRFIRGHFWRLWRCLALAGIWLSFGVVGPAGVEAASAETEELVVTQVGG